MVTLNLHLLVCRFCKRGHHETLAEVRECAGHPVVSGIDFAYVDVTVQAPWSEAVTSEEVKKADAPDPAKYFRARGA